MKSGYVAILGAPNAGKSSLLNSILKNHFAGVSSKPQTTRKNFLGIHTTDTVQILFLDTPGIHKSDKTLNRFMHAQVEEAIDEADVYCFLFSFDAAPDPLLLNRLEEFTKQGRSVVSVINKCDVSQPTWDLRKYPQLFSSFLISAKTGERVDSLLTEFESKLPEGPLYFPEDEVTTVSLREIAAEIIREKAMECLHQEIPYSIAVEVLEFKEDEKPIRIFANLIVEQDSQKGMVVGKRGAMIQKIGTAARTDIMEMLGEKVFLDLFVKVDKNWTKSPAKLEKYGYQKMK